MSNSETTALALFGGFVATVLVVTLAVQIIVAFLLMSCFKSIPREHRKMELGLVWLLLIPCFSVVWNFFVFLRLSDSYLSYFMAQGRTDVGDCGRSLGLAYSICCACALIPYLGFLAGVTALVLLILYLSKALQLKKQITQF